MKSRSPLRLVLLIALLFASAVAVAAQAGRRGTARSSAPAPTPTPSASEPEALPKTPPAPRLEMLVSVNDPSGFDGIPLGAPDKVLDSCVQRLRESNQVTASIAPRRMTRSEAIKAAKAETTRYLIWLEVRNERAESSADISTQNSQIYITYTIFEPISAKIKHSGNARFGTARAGNVGVSGPTGRSAVYSDYAIKETARQAADRILAAFEIRMDGRPL